MPHQVRRWIRFCRLNRPASPNHGPGLEDYQGRGYSYHFWIPPDPDGEFMAGGVYGQYIFIDPVRNVVIARNSADVEWSARQRESAVVMKALARAFGVEDLESGVGPAPGMEPTR